MNKPRAGSFSYGFKFFSRILIRNFRRTLLNLSDWREEKLDVSFAFSMVQNPVYLSWSSTGHFTILSHVRVSKTRFTLPFRLGPWSFRGRRGLRSWEMVLTTLLDSVSTLWTVVLWTEPTKVKTESTQPHLRFDRETEGSYIFRSCLLVRKPVVRSPERSKGFVWKVLRGFYDFESG